MRNFLSFLQTQNFKDEFPRLERLDFFAWLYISMCVLLQTSILPVAFKPRTSTRVSCQLKVGELYNFPPTWIANLQVGVYLSARKKSSLSSATLMGVDFFHLEVKPHYVQFFINVFFVDFFPQGNSWCSSKDHLQKETLSKKEI